MAAESALMEALLRIEHKLDILLHLESAHTVKGLLDTLLIPLGDPRHSCPLCKQPVKYILDQFQKVASRQCSCKTGLIAPVDLSQFAPPAPPQKEIRHDGVQEDGGDPDRRRRKP